MGKQSIKTYIDLTSPFGYLGYYFVRNSPIFKDVDREFVPMLLGGLFQKCDNRPPRTIKNKDKWVEREWKLWAGQFDIPMRENVPPGFPGVFVDAQRLLCYLHLKDPALVPVAMDMMVAAYWAPHSLPASTPKPSSGSEYLINTPADLNILLSPESVLGKALTEEAIGAIKSPEAKAALFKNTDDAFKDGAFGLPYFVCTNAEGGTMGFWGFDHLGQVINFLALDEGLLPPIGGKQRIRPLL